MKYPFNKGMLLGLIGVVAFSLTLPATRFAVPYFGQTIVGLGRTIIAAVMVCLLFAFKKQALPGKEHITSLVIVAGGAVLAFPLLTTFAMKSLPVSHGAVELALLPLATAGFAIWRGGEKPSRRYWTASLIAAATVILYAVHLGFGHVQMGDMALLSAVVILGLSYAEGGKLAKELGQLAGDCMGHSHRCTILSHTSSPECTCRYAEGTAFGVVELVLSWGDQSIPCVCRMVWRHVLGGDCKSRANSICTALLHDWIFISISRRTRHLVDHRLCLHRGFMRHNWERRAGEGYKAAFFINSFFNRPKRLCIVRIVSLH